MTTINIHEAKTHFSRLVERAESGETIVVAKAGRPVAQLGPLQPRSPEERRLGFLRGRVSVPDDFDTIGRDQIQELFDGTRVR